MADNIPVTYKEFEKRLKLVRQHGVAALKSLMEQENKQKGMTAGIDKSAVTNAFGSVISGYLDTALAADLLKVQKGLELNQVPRGDNKPELTNTNQGIKLAQQQAAGYENAPWMAKMDLVADPKLRQAFEAFNNLIQQPTDDKAAFTTQYNDVVAKLEAQLKNKMKLKMAPAPRPKATPRPEPR